MDKAKTNALPERAGRRVELPSRWLSAAAKDLQKKFEGPRILSNRRAASDIEPVSRILYGVAAADGHSSRPVIAERLKRPTRKFGASSRDAWRLFKGSATACASFALALGSSRTALTARSSRALPFLPYLVLLRVGFALPRALLRERCALTAPFHPYPGLAPRAVYSLWHFP